ncbi:hypothetical protein [Anaerobacillus sp. 1_MG-2023]|nr:hypothetical protein [Anaerobacillus sp. 1_MG-2023]MDO6658129.1 hypothetical protein [Anaerobacillus sp. 1_MG-2023]
MIVFNFISHWSLPNNLEKVGTKITDQLQVQNGLLREIKNKIKEVD